MKKNIFYFHIICIAFLIVLVTGCNGSSSEETGCLSEDKELIYHVLVESKPDYFGPQYMHTLPLNAKAHGQGGPDTRANSIKGFVHSFGTSYELQIRSYLVYVDSADFDCIFVDELIRIISETQDELGTVYHYPEVEMSGQPIRKKDDGLYYFSPYQFLCAEDVDCDTLVNISDAGGIVSVELTLTGGEVPVTLTDWH